MAEAKPRTIRVYETKDGRTPFADWLDAFGDESEIAAIIVARIDRVQAGNFGDVAPVGKGVSELRIDKDAGYRVYFGQFDEFVVLLHGGDKSTQDRDIKKAHSLWEEFKSREDDD